MGKNSTLLHTFHSRNGEQIRTVEKVSFSPQILPLYPLAPGPNRPQTGFCKYLKISDLRLPPSLSPQTAFDYNTKTNFYFLIN